MRGGCGIHPQPKMLGYPAANKMNDKFRRIHGEYEELFSTDAVCEWAKSVEKRLDALEDRLFSPTIKATDVTSDISNLMTPNQLSEILQKCMEMILRLMTNAKSCDSKEIEVLFKRISKALDYLRSC